MTAVRGDVPAPLRDYLSRLDRAARDLSWSRRQDLRARVWLEVAGDAGPGASDDDLAAALERLGPPEEQVPAPTGGGGSTTLRDPLVVHLLGCSLLTGGVTGVLGLVRVWRSPTWPVRDALLATLLVAAGAAVFALLVPLHPVLGALLGGLGVAGPLAGLTLGLILVVARRAHRRLRRASQPTAADGL